MPEDSTRKLLRVFGVSMTECEDTLAALSATLRDPGAAGALAAIEAYGQAARELDRQWAEVTRLVQDYRARGHGAIEAYLRERGGR
jgi:hypothetical protein